MKPLWVIFYNDINCHIDRQICKSLTIFGILIKDFKSFTFLFLVFLISFSSPDSLFDIEALPIKLE
ncbi:unnamed protein product [Rodentolepis nana]|uniref:Uncharacterized protein n=1 Tax=Rodentolepis nana TaxID=102285 RepID=A0A0R3TTB2_RODNA|nr:unnamed protein product [Rodentolepis nana]